MEVTSAAVKALKFRSCPVTELNLLTVGQAGQHFSVIQNVVGVGVANHELAVEKIEELGPLGVGNVTAYNYKYVYQCTS